MHAVQVLEPVEAWKVPAKQFAQLDADADEYVPTRQEEHVVADAIAYLPATQAPVTAERPVVAQYDPAEQDTHEVEPVDAWKDPVAQLVQLEVEAIK